MTQNKRELLELAKQEPVTYTSEPWQDAALKRAEQDGWRYDGQGSWCAEKTTSELVTLYLSPQPSEPALCLFRGGRSNLQNLYSKMY
jgi:hypothetical protein